ncbi:uncharacterized protein LOC130783171 [Actinidia eriantha]|uniref:uncharacterized protein LOC130783171 n=1 Tax=Actinidia eriantha TaxID=165200 RepID=UPI002582DE66|nr:uncharacterized protein LOC130783171 [Actinidia eriantha]
MAATRGLLRSQLPKSPLLNPLRSLSTSSPTPTSHRNPNRPDHHFLPPNNFLNSWTPPSDPKEAAAKLAQLRREYAKKVKEMRKEYIHEVELLRLEKQRKDEAKREATRIANEARKAEKAAAKKAMAAEREIAEEEFRKTLLKERAEKLEYWRMREKQVAEKKKDKNELLRRKSSMWIDQPELEKKILESIVDTSPL